ncbi:Increased rDNA silencing protein [Exophiala xenobiotica]|nr:Increased rDNA silencing protein [Exophiala xenobiotica]
MTEKQARRPPVAPKPSFIQRDASTLKISPAPSTALQGATLAFAPAPVKASNAASHNPAAGALLAAAVAASKKRQPSPLSGKPRSVSQNVPSSQPSPSAPRGRTLASPKAPVTAAKVSSTSLPAPTFKPHVPRSTSAVAAIAASATASAKTSPARRPEIRRTSQYLGPPEIRAVGRTRASSTSSNTESLTSLSKSPDALAGAIASMAVAPTQVQTTLGDKHRNELGSIPQLTVQSSQTSTSSSPSPSGTAAAATATRNAAALEAKNRTQSVSGRSVQHEVPVDLRSSARSFKESGWPQVKLSPPQSDSESDDVRTNHEQPRRILPAPLPLRPSRAAMVAQRTGPESQGSPVLDARTKMTASSLADAMVASSVASQRTGSRVSSPKSRPPPPAPRRRSKSVGPVEGIRHHLHFPGLRSETPQPPQPLKPLPARPMRHTLRRQSSDRDEHVEVLHKRGRGHWTRHPNKHHEGDRKRWRDKVTERERKRYEGVWAANRGILTDLDPEMAISGYNKDGTPISDLVTNVVVRDIWERSRLPRDVLEEVWDLVARPGEKALNREEFVVGLWLIDQRLKGRKLPIRVSSSVWFSVRHPQGVKIK